MTKIRNVCMNTKADKYFNIANILYILCITNITIITNSWNVINI